MTPPLSHETLELALSNLAATPQFQAIAQTLRYSEICLVIQDGNYVSGAVRIKTKGTRLVKRRPIRT